MYLAFNLSVTEQSSRNEELERQVSILQTRLYQPAELDRNNVTEFSVEPTIKPNSNRLCFFNLVLFVLSFER